jgi:hypothetical protein
VNYRGEATVELKYSELLSVLGSVLVLLPPLLKSGRIRTILRSIFTHPRTGSILIRSGDTELVFELCDSSPEKVQAILKSLAEQVIKSDVEGVRPANEEGTK